MERHRLPLRDISLNSPSLKRQKLMDTIGQDYEYESRIVNVNDNNKVHQDIPEEEDDEQEGKEEEEEEGEEDEQTEYINRDQLEVERRAEEKRLRQAQQQDPQSIPLPEWQRKWRRIMRESVIYFDSNDLSVMEGLKKKEKEKAIKLFTQVGATIQPFFDHRVTILVSNRTKEELPKNIQTQPLSYDAPHPLKFWNYEKVFRFLRHLGDVQSPEKVPSTVNAKHLSTLLQDEKLHGANDRDPNAKRDDFNYFKYPYFYVYDLRQVTKPVSLREWKLKDAASEKKPWPHLHESTYGHSLFQPDPANINDPRKRERRRARDEQNKKYRDKLKAIYSNNPLNFEIYSDSDDDEESDDNYNNEEESFNTTNLGNTTQNFNFDMPPPQSQISHTQSVLQPLVRQNSFLPNKFIESNKRDNFEIEASGYNGSAANGTNQSNEFSKNGLIATASTVPSKEVSSLHRRMIEKKQKMTQQEQIQQSNKPKVSGYCENCRVHFDDFDDHCYSASHRAFAEEDANFHEIDDLIMKLQDNISNKRV